jgi:enoyl-CoA hydratase
MPGDEHPAVSVTLDEGVALLRINRPPLNVLSRDLQDAVAAAATRAAADHAVRALVLWGGPRVFSAGADVAEMAAWDVRDAADEAPRMHAAFDAVARVPVPTVAAITGYALGGGCELALCCDRRVAGDNAKLGQPEIKLGIVPGAGGTQRLPRLVGPARAKDLVLTGRLVEADEAWRIGLVDQVVAPDDVLDEALAWARSFAAGPAYALRAAKAAIDDGLETDLGTGLALERQHFVGLFATQDRAEGMRSFVTDGPGKARFVGR